MNCKYLKTMTKRCSKLNKIVSYKDCSQCSVKEYKEKNKNAQYFKNNVQKNKNNVNFCIKSANNDKILQKKHKIKSISSKRSKMERNRFSVFTDDLKKCFFCDNPKDDMHELIPGRNRRNCMKYGFCLPICRYHHDLWQEDITFKKHWAKNCQNYFEQHYGTRDEFIEIFKKNYL